MSLGAAGQKLNLRLFLEGIEVPVIAAQVQCNINAPATASIQIVPDDSAMQFKPRTMVHLFFWDFSQDLPTPQSNQGSVPPFSGYRLLFVGEVIGLTYTKNPLQRSMVLQCADLSTYWDTTYQMFISYGPRGNFFNESSAIWAGGNSMFNDLLDGHVSVLNDYLKRSPKSDGLQNVKGLMGGIISLLEAMGGVANHTRGVNDFFTVAELKNHILQQIVAEQDDDTAQRLFDAKAFMEWLTRGITGAGELVTFRDMLKLLFKWIYYEVIPVTTPYYVQGTQGVTSNKKVTTTTQTVPAGTVTQVQGLRGQAVAQTQLATMDAAASASVAKGMDGPLTALVTDNTLPQTFTNPINAALIILGGLINQTSTTSVDLRIAWNQVATFLNQAIFTVSGVTSTKTVTTKSKPTLDHLNTQIFRPDCFFAAPPKCNVIFPEHEVSFSFNRQFLQEITRLRLNTSGFLTGGGMFGEAFYAPVMSEIQQLAKMQGNSGIRALLPWEIHTGILPKFEHMSEINYVANKQERLLQKDIRGKAYGFGQRAANFNFFKYRFAARSIDLSTRFNPWMVLGFPALIIDKPWLVDTSQAKGSSTSGGSAATGSVVGADVLSDLRTMAVLLKAPLQYLGMVAGLTHNVDQGGGQTSASLTHARSHRITEDDFLGIFATQMTGKAGQQVVKTVLVADQLVQSGDLTLLRFLIDSTPQNASSVASMQAPSPDLSADNGSPLPLSSRPSGLPSTPNSAQASSVLGNSVLSASPNVSGSTITGNTNSVPSKVDRTTVLEPSPYGKLKPGGKGPKGGTVIQIQLGSNQIQKLTGASASAAGSSVGSPSSPVLVWSQAVIVESVKGAPLSSNIPFEELIRPPWFSPLYSSIFIGDRIYKPFFGTGSVVDEGMFLTPQGNLLTNTSQSRSALITQLLSADGDTIKTAQIFEQAKSSGSIKDVPSVEQAVDALAYVYGQVKRQGLDVHRFVSDYTSRPIATLEQMLGSFDLQYAPDATGKKLTVVSGTPGFHSAAIAPFDNLLGLLDNPDAQLPRLSSTGKKGPISTTLDPRPTRRARVVAYAGNIQASIGGLAVGLKG